VTAGDDYQADVHCEDGVVGAIGRDLPAHRFVADRTIDASGQYVMPGGIDVHTHLNMPFGGPTTSSRALLPPPSAAPPASSTSTSSTAAGRCGMRWTTGGSGPRIPTSSWSTIRRSSAR
jgi:predicted amidohydrolase